MASSSSPVPQRKYDVFLSFRGTDTRRGFVSHLYKALSDKAVEAFIDYKLQEGNEISPALHTAIEESEISLIIFSIEYASSKWCLEELVKIIECREKYGQIVVPIFYYIDPSSVRNQKGNYASAFIEHEKRFKHEILQKWRTALQKAADLSGFDVSNFETEVDLIEMIVEHVMIRLNEHVQPIDLKRFVGIYERIARVELLLCTKSQDVRIIGIWGMGGIGKTTIANLIFNRLRYEYEGHHFLENVREELERYGITHLKNKLLSKLLGEVVQIDMHTEVTPFLKRRLGRKKVLVILDDVNHPDQLNILTGGRDWFGQGSRIIMTSRNKHALNRCDEIYEVEALHANEAQQLFNLHAFRESSIDDKCSKLSTKIIDYAKGIPLALKVLGSFLYDKSEDEWESAMQKLRKMPCAKIQNVLKLSYDGLDDEEKAIFLYLACYFMGSSKQQITKLLDACGYSTTIGLRSLQDRALIIVSTIGGVSMHDLIQEMGREIVRGKSRKDPSKRRHLWDPYDIYRVLKNNTGTEAIESILLDMSRMEKELHLRPQAFARMVNLKFLFIHRTSSKTEQCMLHLPYEGLELPLDEMRYFYWVGYPSTSFPSSAFYAENLVEFHMPNSSIQRLWDGTQDLGSLKVLHLDNSQNLLELPDLSKAINLETVSLSDCSSLRHLHPSLLSSHKLVSLDLHGCKELKSLRSHVPLRSLEYIIMTNCSSLKDFSVISERMATLELDGTAIEELPSSIGQLKNLETLSLYDCQSLKTVPNEVSDLRYLETLSLSNCREFDSSNLSILFHGLRCLKDLRLENCCNLFGLPENIDLLSLLQHLSLVGSNVETLPASIKHLSQLMILRLWNCPRLGSIPELPPSIECLDVMNCTSLERVITSSSVTEPSSTTDCYESMYKLVNCVALDESALEIIVMDFQCRMKAKAFEHVSHSPPYYVGSVCFPGSKVPDHFRYRTTQDLLSMSLEELSPHIKLMGFIFCIVVSQPQPYKEYHRPIVKCKCYLEASDGERVEYISEFVVEEVLGLVSDHVYLWYDGRFTHKIMNRIKGSTALTSDQSPKVSLEFHVEQSDARVIQKTVFGICPIYISESQNILGIKTKRSENVEDAQEVSTSESLMSTDMSNPPIIPESKKLKSIHLPSTSN